jgi:hypothetical protein
MRHSRGSWLLLKVQIEPFCFRRLHRCAGQRNPNANVMNLASTVQQNVIA